ncbi:MAG: (2Fe-2S)-binding protein [Phycisphaeraceae bacterium]|nr:(2Fe-2S)-binding protein [Phycisphaeraceae bacterium]
MPSITINGRSLDFTPGQTILQIANANGIEIPQYCYHEGLSIVASCRICLVECMAPNPKSGTLEPFMGGKLLPSCQQTAVDGMVVMSDSPKAVANQKAVMEYLLINHPLDCPVCDQSGECFLQDYSYEYGRGVSRFEESKVKNPKKDVGPHVYLYSDRCIMCTRCVRFTREVSGTAELLVQGRGNKEEIDVFPGVPLDNELSANVVDLCPVGALLDKDFLFAQRVWFLRETAGIDPLTASGDNIWIHNNEGRVYRVKPRANPAINKWWITDEVRYGWKFVHSEDRLRSPMRRQFGALVECDYTKAYDDVVDALRAAVAAGKKTALVVSPMLTCEDAFALAAFARKADPNAILALGHVPFVGTDKVFPAGAREDDPKAFKMYAEKAPNARGVKRVLDSFGGEVLTYDQLLPRLGAGTGSSDINALIITGNYPADWVANDFLAALAGKFVVLIDTLLNTLVDKASVVLPGATFAEKAGTFENARHVLQAFDQAIPVIPMAKSEGQIALDLTAVLDGQPAPREREVPVVIETTRGQVAAGAQVALPYAQPFVAASIRRQMAAAFPALAVFADGVRLPPEPPRAQSGMKMVEL